MQLQDNNATNYQNHSYKINILYTLMHLRYYHTINHYNHSLQTNQYYISARSVRSPIIFLLFFQSHKLRFHLSIFFNYSNERTKGKGEASCLLGVQGGEILKSLEGENHYFLKTKKPVTNPFCKPVSRLSLFF